ncbi:DUF177 domain-containing protein [Caenimonas sedimenti]|uniref:Large ribosomal RNA subunit accumulation protein YceD n=1 Tax=Caenimonas sedimenti TaxID=2596921 RepID=A0A562ZKA4_9BURK|nr:YceD family protein [Caenimonas sedimenti]TWO68923.1 DUF177 domain-containing protein [Caenimonas sedimenti]
MPKEFDPRRLDVRRFAEEAGTLAGVTPALSFPRLASELETVSASNEVRWTATGELRNPEHVHPEMWLYLEAEATFALTCQRCLQPVDVEVMLERPFRFVADEATAAAEDDEAEEEVLALSREFDLLELVEDELIMDLPVAPMHETCPVPVRMSSADPAYHLAEAERQHPFAVLGKLKAGKS